MDCLIQVVSNTGLTVYAKTSHYVIYESKKICLSILTLYSIDTHFDYQQQTAFENIVGKGEIARNEQFVHFPQCFLLNKITVSPFVHIFDIISLFAARLEEPKIGISGEGLTTSHSLVKVPSEFQEIYQNPKVSTHEVIQNFRIS